MADKIYVLDGRLAIGDYDQGFDILYCGHQPVAKWADAFLPDRRQVSIRYWVTDKPVSIEEAQRLQRDRFGQANDPSSTSALLDMILRLDASEGLTPVALASLQDLTRKRMSPERFFANVSNVAETPWSTAHEPEALPAGFRERAIKDALGLLESLGYETTADGLRLALSQPQCVGCEGRPKEGNNPCAVCGLDTRPRTVQPPASDQWKIGFLAAANIMDQEDGRGPKSVRKFAAEYRANLTKGPSPYQTVICQHDKSKPNPTLMPLGSAAHGSSDWMWACTVCNGRFRVPMGTAQGEGQ